MFFISLLLLLIYCHNCHQYSSVFLATLSRSIEHWSASTTYWTRHRLHRNSSVALHRCVQAIPTTEVEVGIVEEHAQIERPLYSFELERMHTPLQVMTLRNKVCVCNVICAKSIINEFHMVVKAQLGGTHPTFSPTFIDCRRVLSDGNRRHLDIFYQLERRCDDVFFLVLRNIKSCDLRRLSLLNR